MASAEFDGKKLRLRTGYRAALFAREYPRIFFPHEASRPPLGYIHELSRNVSIQIGGYTRERDQWVMGYFVRDSRPRLLRSSLPSSQPEVDEHGYVKEPTAKSIERAAEASAYTSSPGAALSHEPEAVDRETQKEFTKRSREGKRVPGIFWRVRRLR